MLADTIVIGDLVINKVTKTIDQSDYLKILLGLSIGGRQRNARIQNGEMSRSDPTVVDGCLYGQNFDEIKARDILVVTFYNTLHNNAGKQ